MDEATTSGGSTGTINIGVDLPVQVFEAPEPIPANAGVPLPPDSRAYRMKQALLGQPLHSDELERTVGVFHNRLAMLNPNYKLLVRDT